MVHVSLSKRCRSWCKKNPQKLWVFLHKFINISNDQKIYKLLLCIFSQDINYKLFLLKLSQKSWWIKFNSYLKLVNFQFLIHLLPSNIISFEQSFFWKLTFRWKNVSFQRILNNPKQNYYHKFFLRNPRKISQPDNSVLLF